MRNLNIQLSEPAFAEAKRVAAASGVSVEEIIAADVEAHFAFGGDVPDSFFTPAILAEIDEARAEAKLGGSLTLDQVRVQRLAKSKVWRENRRD
jgi:hypothetical protein